MFFGFHEPDVPSITPEDANAAITAKAPVVVLDVRTPEEFAKNHLPQAINIPIDQIDSSIEKTLTNKKQKIYVYCLSGARSSVAVEKMIKKGYTNVFNIRQGLLAWRVKRLPLA